MPIVLNEQQQRVLDAERGEPSVIDPRTSDRYVLLSTTEFERVQSLLEEERQLVAFRRRALDTMDRREHEVS